MNVQIVESTRQRIDVVISTGVEDVRIREGIQGLRVEIAGGVPNSMIGAPDLPQIVFEVALPPRTTIADVAVRNADIVVLRERAVLRAVQPPAPGSCRRGTRLRDDGRIEPWPAPHPVPPDPELYRRAYAEERASADVAAVDDTGPNAIGRLIARPLALRNDGSLVLCKTLQLTIRLMPSYERAAARQRRTAFYSRQQALRWAQLAVSRVINPNDIAHVGDHFGILSHADYLIITSNRRWNAEAIAPGDALDGDAVAQFERLAAWKRMKGLRARVVTIDDIVAGRYGTFTGACRRDLQEVLREFLKWAYENWGIAWLLLGGNVEIVPIRKVVGYAGGISPGADNPPGDGASYWTGSELHLHTTQTIHDVIRTSDGRRLRFGASASGGSPHWFYTDKTYSKVSMSVTEYLRVQGSAADLANEELFILNEDNEIPTDLYYANVAGYMATTADPLYFCNARTGALGQRCTTRDWDWLDNGLYGQYNNDGDFGGETYTADISVGRAPVSCAADAKAFVDKVIAYEKGSVFSGQWIRRLLLVSSNWGGRTEVTKAKKLGDNQYVHAAGDDHTLIQLASAPATLQTRLIKVNGSEKVLVFRTDASPSQPGWTFVRSASDLSPAVIPIGFPWGSIIELPWPTRWIVVYGSGDLAPATYVVDEAVADDSMTDQEQLRVQLASSLPGWSNVDRLYEDDVDLDPAAHGAAPIAHLTAGALQTQLNGRPHIVSLSGHGNWWGCCFLDAGISAALSNAGTPFIAYADSCLTNEFDRVDAISEVLVNNANGGAVAYVGNSRFSWINVGDAFQRNFFAGLPGTTAIGLLQDRRCAGVHLVQYAERYNRWSIFALNLVGDPEMRIRTHALRSPCLELEATARSDRPFKVRVVDDKGPVHGAVVTATSGEWSTRGVSDANGDAALSLGGAPVGDVTVAVDHPELTWHCKIVRVTGPIWQDAQLLGVDAGFAGVWLHARINGEEQVVQLSPCARDGLSQVVAVALGTGRTVRLQLVQDGAATIVEHLSLT